MCNFSVIRSSSNSETVESLRTFNMMTDYLKYAVKHFGFRNTYALKTTMKNGCIPQQEQCLENLARFSLLVINCTVCTVFMQVFLFWFALHQKKTPQTHKHPACFFPPLRTFRSLRSLFQCLKYK